MPKFTKGHYSWNIFQNFIQKLITPSTHHYQSSHQVSRLYLQQFSRYFADKVKMPKITKGQNSWSIFFKINSKVNQVTTNLFIKFQGSSLNSFLDILLTREKCQNLQRAITHEIFFKIYSKVNQIIYLLLPINSPGFNTLAPTVFEIFCWQGKNG